MTLAGKLGIQNAIGKLSAQENITAEEAFQILTEIREGEATEVQIAGFLAALTTKGPVPEEIAAIASSMRKLCNVITPKVEGYLTDTCGTGGGKTTFNISTADAIVAAAAGVPIAKHGSRSISSKSGSADVLEALGVDINLRPQQAEKLIEKVGISFLYAPLFHPIMHRVFPPENALGVKTIFYTIIGPLINPADARNHLMGVYKPDLVKVIPNILEEMDFVHAMVVHSSDGMDEMTTTAETLVGEVNRGSVEVYEVTPEEVGLPRSRIPDVTGNFTPKENAEILRRIFQGRERGPKRDMVLLNAGGVCYCGDIASDLSEGVEIARNAIDEGEAYRKLQDLIKYSNMLGESDA
jgi:anthranilate phosphoribosyltransferase